MSEKIAVITGSHKGLGFEIARQLAKQFRAVEMKNGLGTEPEHASN